MGFFSKIGFKSLEEFQLSVNNLLQTHGLPNEKLVEFAIVQERPSIWYFLIGWMIYIVLTKNYMLILTNMRLLLVDLGVFSNNPNVFTPYNLKDIKFLKLSKGLLTHTLKLQFPDGRKRNFSFAKTFIKSKDASLKAETMANFLQSIPINTQTTPIPQSSQMQPTPKHSSPFMKIILIVILAVVAILVLLLVVGLIAGDSDSKKVSSGSSPTPSVKTQSGSSKTQTSQGSAELNGFPIFPGATLVRKDDPLNCDYPQSELSPLYPISECNSFMYYYKTDETFENVLNWYANESPASDWLCNIDTSRTLFMETKCNKAGLEYGLIIDDFEDLNIRAIKVYVPK